MAAARKASSVLIAMAMAATIAGCGGGGSGASSSAAASATTASSAHAPAPGRGSGKESVPRPWSEARSMPDLGSTASSSHAAMPRRAFLSLAGAICRQAANAPTARSDSDPAHARADRLDAAAQALSRLPSPPPAPRPALLRFLGALQDLAAVYREAPPHGGTHDPSREAALATATQHAAAAAAQLRVPACLPLVETGADTAP